MIKLNAGLDNMGKGVGRWWNRLTGAYKSEVVDSVAASMSMITPIINHKQLVPRSMLVNHGKKGGMFGRRLTDNPRRIFKGFAHMKSAARWASTQPWLLQLQTVALRKLHNKMAENKTLPENGIKQAVNIWWWRPRRTA